MTWRAAVIGCGKIGSEFADDPRITGIYSHAGAYAASDRTELVAVADSDAEKAARAASRWGLDRGYTDLAALLSEREPQIVSVCTPDATHAAVLTTVLRAPGVKAVLAEKPLAPTLGEAQALVHLARDRGVTLAVNHSRRYSASHARVRDAISGGKIGDVQRVIGFYTGGVRHNGSHWFDLVRWLVGEVNVVQGFGPPAEDDPDPSIDVRLTFEGGAIGTLHALGRAPFGIFEMDLVGTTGRIRLSDSGHRIETFHVGDNPHYSGYRALLPSSAEQPGLADVMVNAVEDLIASVESGRQPACSGDDGVATLRIADAAIESSARGIPIALRSSSRVIKR